MTSAAQRLLADYVAIPSVNPMNREDLPAEQVGERRYAEQVQADARRLGLDAELVGRGERLSVVIEARPSSDAADSVLVASHLDTVPVDTMEISPFDPRVADGRMYGRGACDTKAGMAAALAALAAVLERGQLRRRVVLVGQADEEATSVGVYDVLAHLGARPPAWGIATEPTENRLVTHHKGVARCRITARGVACHASDPSQGDNAIHKLARAVLALEAHASALAATVDPVLGPATLNVGLLRGGQAPNIVPDLAYLLLDRRVLPGETEASVGAAVAQALADAGLELELDCHMEKSPLGIPADAHAARVAAEALRGVGLLDQAQAVAFGTDAGLFSDRGLPCVVLGPGSIREAHTAREFVALDQLEQATRFFLRLFGG